jgi:uncharacterized SAM-binding protein YcdF (DUF218 family)
MEFQLQTNKIIRSLLLGILALSVVSVAVGWNLGRWLAVDDPLEKSDAILVLSGGLPERALEAARVYKQGYARQVWLTHSMEPAATLKKLTMGYIGEDAYDKQLLMREGVPESAIHLLETAVANTADEIRVAGLELRQQNQHKIIIVTSKVHTRRAKTIWRRLANNDSKAIVRGATDDVFDERRWWKTTTGALDVVREVLGLLNAWAGFPLQPAN